MSKKLILIAGAAVVLLGGGGAAAYFFFLQGEEAQAAAPPPPDPGVVALDPFLTNLAPDGGRHKARLQVTLAVTPKELAPTIGEDPLLVARIRDQILSKLGSSSYEELSSPAGKQKLRRSIETSVSALLEGGEVHEALFVDFVLQ